MSFGLDDSQVGRVAAKGEDTAQLRDLVVCHRLLCRIDHIRKWAVLELDHTVGREQATSIRASEIEIAHVIRRRGAAELDDAFGRGAMGLQKLDERSHRLFPDPGSVGSSHRVSLVDGDPVCILPLHKILGMLER